MNWCGIAPVSQLDSRNCPHCDSSVLKILATRRGNFLLQSVWLPPDPPPGHGVHRYLFQLFMLGLGPSLAESPGCDAFRNAVQQRGLASGCLIGSYERASTEIREASDTEAPLISA